MERIETRKLRLRNLLHKVSDFQDGGERGTEALHNLSDIINETNQCVNSVDIKELACNTDEVQLDSKVISSTTLVCSEAVDAFEVDDAYNIDEFVVHLQRYLDGDAFILNWDKIEDEHLMCFKPIPAFHYVYGGFADPKDAGPTQLKERRATKRLGNCEKKRPDNVRAIDKEEESVDETVRTMLAILREAYQENDSKPVSYYEFVLNPTDFGKTVENVFHFSFLIRDGAVKIIPDEGQSPNVEPVTKSSHNTHRQKNVLDNKQQVMSLDYSEWLEHRNDIPVGIYDQKRQTGKYAK